MQAHLSAIFLALLIVAGSAGAATYFQADITEAVEKVVAEVKQ